MTGGVWVASYALLWVAVLVLGVAVVVLLRQIGVLHARLGPQGVHGANEGPVRDAAAPAVGGFAFGEADVTLVTFTSPTCEICHALVPSLGALQREYPGTAVEVVEHGPATLGVFRGYAVTSTPYVVAVDRSGMVRGGGVANSLEQVEVFLGSVHPRQDLAT